MWVLTRASSTLSGPHSRTQLKPEEAEIAPASSNVMDRTHKSTTYMGTWEVSPFVCVCVTRQTPQPCLSHCHIAEISFRITIPENLSRVQSRLISANFPVPPPTSLRRLADREKTAETCLTRRNFLDHGVYVRLLLCKCLQWLLTAAM
jgi:hypothetical protein